MSPEVISFLRKIAADKLKDLLDAKNLAERAFGPTHFGVIKLRDEINTCVEAQMELERLVKQGE